MRRKVGESGCCSLVQRMRRITRCVLSGLKRDTGVRWRTNDRGIQVSKDYTKVAQGYVQVEMTTGQSVELTFDMPPRLISPHPSTRQDTVTVSRGPIVYSAEDVDNASLEDKYPHFEGLGLVETAQFDEEKVVVGGVEVIALRAREGVFGL